MTVPVIENRIKNTLWQFSRFLTVGVGNALVDFIVYIFLTRSFIYWQEHYLLANFLAFLIANFNSFYWNRRWTFKVKHGKIWRQYFEFLSTSLVYIGFIQLGLWWLVSHLGVYDLLAKIIIIGLGMILYFRVLKKLIFCSRIDSVF